MRTITLVLLSASISLAACNNSDKETKEVKTDSTGTTAVVPTDTLPDRPAANPDMIVQEYLSIKNSLAADDATGAANASKALVPALTALQQAPLSEDQRHTFMDMKDDISEHAEHISTNATNIAHQREHFQMLSKDMLDLVKVFPHAQPLYKVNCPMYNKGKGADWISEFKEIKNPYLGKAMLTCGSVKETLK